jgi:hypothetical protein
MVVRGHRAQDQAFRRQDVFHSGQVTDQLTGTAAGCGVLARPDATLRRDLFWRMKFRNQKAMRSGDWKYLSLDGDEFLFDLSADQRERANRGRREPERLAAMRARYATWETAIPPLPADATFSIPYTKADLAQPS